MRSSFHRPLVLLMLGLAVLMTQTGCADASYYFQSASGHLALMRAARPVEDWLADSQASVGLKARLEMVQHMRRFAVTDLALPDNASYTRYADLKRRAVVWNVVAAPEFSLTLKTWCFPVMGCVGYRGYFEEVQARALAQSLKAEGLEVSVYGVPAYSTLGWMNWAGGDPLLNTFINYPEGELARLLFHELAHQVVYVKDDTTFNESFATAVERLGGAQWLTQHGSPTARAEVAANAERRAQFRALTTATRRRLAGIYKKNEASAPTPVALSAMKIEAMTDFRAQYEQLRASWAASLGSGAGQVSAYDAWVANANNAAFGAQGAYDDLVPDFEALFARLAADPDNSGNRWPRFYDAVARLAALPAAERTSALKDPGRKLP